MAQTCTTLKLNKIIKTKIRNIYNNNNRKHTNTTPHRQSNAGEHKQQYLWILIILGTNIINTGPDPGAPRST